MTKITDIISHMRALEGTFPKREQLVADFVLASLEQISFLSQHKIAEGANVSVATVNRFCSTIGCDGFRDFQIRLAQCVAVSLPYIGEPSAANTETGKLVTQIFSTLVNNLKLARAQLDGKLIETATDALANARRIAFLGVGGGSANIAREGANRFFRLGIPSEAHADGYLQRMLAATFTEGDVIVAISSTGQPTELLDSVAIAKQYGAVTISLTKTNSDLAKLADISIQIDIPEDQDIYKPSASRLVYIAIIDVLAAGAARKRPEHVKETLRRIRTSLVTLSKDSGPKPIGD